MKSMVLDADGERMSITNNTHSTLGTEPLSQIGGPNGGINPTTDDAAVYLECEPLVSSSAGVGAISESQSMGLDSTGANDGTNNTTNMNHTMSSGGGNNERASAGAHGPTLGAFTTTSASMHSSQLALFNAINNINKPSTSSSSASTSAPCPPSNSNNTNQILTNTSTHTTTTTITGIKFITEHEKVPEDITWIDLTSFLLCCCLDESPKTGLQKAFIVLSDREDGALSLQQLYQVLHCWVVMVNETQRLGAEGNAEDPIPMVRCLKVQVTCFILFFLFLFLFFFF
jgi:hypothetical protein